MNSLKAPFAIIALSVCSLTSGLAAAEKRIALVIGNSAYRDARLVNPVNDARLIAKTLRDLGFKVLEHLDVDQKGMKRAIQDFGDELEQAGKDAVGLFYYAGHGIQVDGVNYLVPVNAAIERERDVGIEAVSTTAVLGTLDFARNRLNFVIMDACRNNPYARSFRSASRGLARMDAPRGTLVAYATAPGNVALDGTGANSPYTAALVRAMQEPKLPVEQMFKNVRRSVMAETTNRQVPWESSSLTGDFYFKQAPAGQPSAKGILTPSPATTADKEVLFWQSVKDSGNVADFEEYSRQFPSGTFVGLARNRIAALTKTETAEAGKVEPPGTEASRERASEPMAKVGESAPAAVTKGIVAVEREPNNRFGQANDVDATSSIRGRIDPKRDVDWYRLSIQKQGELKVRATDIAPTLDIVFRVWNREHRAITNWYAPTAPGTETNAVIDFPSAGDYYLEVRDGRNDANSTQEHLISLAFTPTDDALEPNDAFGTAAKVTPGQTWKATILPRREADWYRLRIDEQGELTVLISDVPQNLDVTLRVWNAEKSAVSGWYAPLKAGGNTRAVIDLPRPGSYFLEVRDGRNDARSVQPFTISLTFKPTRDPFEPNDSFGRATPLALGETVTATILPQGDIDWYRVETDEQGELGVAITGVPETLDIVFRVWNTEKRAISGWYAPLKAGGNTDATIDLPRPGAYFFEVRDGRNNARSVQPYSLGLSFTPTKDLGEPNDSFGTATPIKIGAAVRGTILPKGDVDWFRIWAHRPGELTVQIAESPPDLDMTVRVWNGEKRAMSGWLAPLRAGGETKGRVSLPNAGEYFLEVRDGKNDGRSASSYRLTASLPGP